AAFPTFLGCDRSVDVGAVIMGSAVVESTARTVQLTRDGAPVACGGTYVAGEALLASLSSTAGQYMFDVSGATLGAAGRCDGARTDNTDGVTVTAPTTGTITIRAAWAPGFGIVTKTPDCTLTLAAAETTQPTANPTLAPTLDPTVALTVNPTPALTQSPTLSPTQKPTLSVLQVVSASPTS
ncbi:hypothetical protein M885DRAFT_418033, partial [Pelagophyceae sp. CCMP2097]